MASDTRRAAEALDVSLIVRAWIAGSVCKHDLNTKNCGLCMMAQIKVMIDAARTAGFNDGLEASLQVAVEIRECWPPFDTGRSAIARVEDEIRALTPAPVADAGADETNKETSE